VSGKGLWAMDSNYIENSFNIVLSLYLQDFDRPTNCILLDRAMGSQKSVILNFFQHKLPAWAEDLFLFTSLQDINKLKPQGE
jgi:hypothetical protein